METEKLIKGNNLSRQIKESIERLEAIDRMFLGSRTYLDKCYLKVDGNVSRISRDFFDVALTLEQKRETEKLEALEKEFADL